MLIGLFLIQGPITFESIETNEDDSTSQKILIFVEQTMSSTPFIIALPIFTYIFHRYCKSRFEPCFKNFPLEVNYIVLNELFDIFNIHINHI